jgi:hypothetical protein
LLATYDQLVWVNGVQVYPIYKSTDNGTSWTHLTDVVPNRNFPTLTRTSQPFLFELPQAVGSLAEGTILLAENIMPSDESSTRIVIYKSTDQGAHCIKWVPAGGPNGMVIISSKWALDSSRNISGGENFYVNYNLGKGKWERLPQLRPMLTFEPLLDH